MDLIGILQQTGVVGWFILLLLLVMSIISWGIAIQKWRVFSRLKKDCKEFVNRFWDSRNLEDFYVEVKRNFPASPTSNVFQAGYIEMVKLSKKPNLNEPALAKNAEGEPVKTALELGQLDNIERALSRTANEEVGNLSKSLSFLGTTGSTAPFIGLFGTVVGIMHSFRQIGLSGSANIADVAPGISEALLATAAGLAAAIPAVIFYNHFNTQLKNLAMDMENFTSDFLNLIKRHMGVPSGK